MQSYKFKFQKLILILFFLCVSSMNLMAFTTYDCLNASYDSSVTHPSSPFGLLMKNIKISKRLCEVTITHTSYEFYQKKWVIDVCRGPVHVKYGVGSVSVYKRDATMCKKGIKGDKSDFCVNVFDLEDFIQDDGLIFAKGEKEDLKSDHGKMYCAFLLVNKYLMDGYIFSRHRLERVFEDDFGELFDKAVDKIDGSASFSSDSATPAAMTNATTATIPTTNTNTAKTDNGNQAKNSLSSPNSGTSASPIGGDTKISPH